MIYRDRGNFRRRREQIIHKASVDELPLFIIDESLIKGSPYTLRHAAMHLPFDDHGINHAPAIVHSHVFDECHHARFRINLDDRSMGATGKTAMRRAVKLAGFKTCRSTFWWQRSARARAFPLLHTWLAAA